MAIDLEAYKLNVRLAEEDLEGAIPTEQHTISMCKSLIAAVERLTVCTPQGHVGANIEIGTNLLYCNCRQVAIRAISAIVQGVGEMPFFPPTKPPSRWIPVTERLPEPGTWFVGVAVSEEVDFNTRLPKVTTLMLRGYPYFALDPRMTHWMPLPEPPK